MADQNFGGKFTNPGVCFCTYVTILYMGTKEAVKLCLKVLGLAGLRGVIVITPNAVRGLEIIIRKKSKVVPNSFGRLLNDMKRRGYIHVTQDGNSFHYSLTPAGAHRLQQIIIDEVKIPKPKKWDRHWRLVTFDVPVKSSTNRVYFTRRLEEMGFVMLQRSIWVHPYPCFKQAEQIAAYFNILRYCTFMEVTKFDELSVKRLLRQFPNLS